MKNLIKKNQLMITALAIMIAIAGYLQFAGNGLEDDYLKVEDDNVETGNASPVDSDGIISQNETLDGLLDLSEEDLLAGYTDIGSLDTDLDIIADDYLDSGMEVADTSGAAEGEITGVTPEEGEVPGEAVFTSTQGVSMLSDAKLLKEQTRAKNKETLLEIINSAGLSDDQKQSAVDSMVEMTAIAEKEAAAEILLEAKGFQDVVVSINGNAVDVVVNAAALDDVMRAQIEDIVKRKTEIPAENIIISTVANPK
ncbi:MAG: SpoIIIAH-like family protein [Lachnospiraceae bacterium]|nr:SpoIIIAH-like family protein [Lachnospiraceae bacterium]